MGATDPMWLPPRPGPTWPRSWRSSPKSPLTTQVLMLRFLANVCLPQRFRPAKPHPKPSNVSWGELFKVSPLTLLLRGTVGEGFSWELGGIGCGPSPHPLFSCPSGAVVASLGPASCPCPLWTFMCFLIIYEEKRGSVMGVCVQRLGNHFTDMVCPMVFTSSITSKEGPAEQGGTVAGSFLVSWIRTILLEMELSMTLATHFKGNYTVKSNSWKCSRIIIPAVFCHLLHFFVVSLGNAWKMEKYPVHWRDPDISQLTLSTPQMAGTSF